MGARVTEREWAAQVEALCQLTYSRANGLRRGGTVGATISRTRQRLEQSSEEIDMSKHLRGAALATIIFALVGHNPATLAQDTRQAPYVAGADTKTVQIGDIVPPKVAAPCAPAACPFKGQTVTVLVTGGRPIRGAILEVQEEYEAATGAKLNVVSLMLDEHFVSVISDGTRKAGKYDVSMAGAWWLGELVGGNFLLSYDRFYGDPRFPKWDIDDVLPAPRSLLSYGKHKYMVALDHDGQVMYYRRDLLEDPAHRTAFARRYGYPLDVPKTWEQFRAVAEYFNGKDLNGDGIADHGLTLPLQIGGQSMFNFINFSAPYVLGPSDRNSYWFDPASMKPLIEGPGHQKAMQDFVALIPLGPREMLTWDLGASWDHFLQGRAAVTFTWGDLGALAQQEGSRVKGRIGSAPLPGTNEYYSRARQAWIKTPSINRVGNTVGGSWAGVISRYSKVPEAAYYLLALMATKEKSLVYAARGWDGIDPGRRSQFLPPHGTAHIDDYVRLGWNAADARDYSAAYAETFSNPLQIPYLRIPGAFSYWQALDVHLREAAAGHLSAPEALKATAVAFEEITVRLGRAKQGQSYRTSLEK